MQLKWPGADGGDTNFFPKGGSEAFNVEGGPLRRQILDKSNFVQGKLGGYQELRPAMKRAFAAVSRDGTDNGNIASPEEFTQLMTSVGEELSEEEYERLWALCRDRKEAFRGQTPGTVVFEQWVAVMLQTAEEANGSQDKPWFGLF